MFNKIKSTILDIFASCKDEDTIIRCTGRAIISGVLTVFLIVFALAALPVLLSYVSNITVIIETALIILAEIALAVCIYNIMRAVLNSI